MDFPVLPPEINSALMYSGAESGSLFAAAAAWDGLAAEFGGGGVDGSGGGAVCDGGRQLRLRQRRSAPVRAAVHRQRAITAYQDRVARTHTVTYGSARPPVFASAGWVVSNWRTRPSVLVRTSAGEVMQ